MFEEEDPVSDMDLLSALCEVQENENINNNNNCNLVVKLQDQVTTPSITNTNTILNNVPKALFANCNVTIGTINFNIKNN